ncbi:MAG: purine-nucleoside phosphorylase [Bacilli bacterium]
MTPHIKAKKEEIAKTVIMPGDPVRTKLIAEKYLTDYKLVNDVRNILAYTGYYKNKLVTIMASGMGIPSMGIYSYELFKFYDVDNIIRVGTSGSYSEQLNVRDLFLVEKSYSDSTYGLVQSGDTSNFKFSSKLLNDKIKTIALEKNINILEGTIYCSEVFYKQNENFKEVKEKYGCQCVEMESFSLFHNAQVLNKQASCIVTISDSFVTNEALSSDERATSFMTMVELALESI